MTNTKLSNYCIALTVDIGTGFDITIWPRMAGIGICCL